MDAMAKKDFGTAKKYATKESETMLGMLETMMKMAPDSAKDKKFDKSNLQYGDVKIDGDKAIIPVKNKDSNETTNYTLRKQDGNWKVAFDKSSLGGDKSKNAMGSEGNSPDSTSKMMDEMNKLGSDSFHTMPSDSIK